MENRLYCLKFFSWIHFLMHKVSLFPTVTHQHGMFSCHTYPVKKILELHLCLETQGTTHSTTANIEISQILLNVL